MLLANAVVYSAENSYLSATTLSSAQLQEHDYASVLAGVASYSSLASTQSILQSTPMDCSSSQAYLDSLGGTQDVKANNQSIWYSETSSWGYASAPVSPRSDALLPSQFDGYTEGDLNLQVITGVNETFAGGLPSYAIQDIEVVHLSIQPQRMATQCLSALSDLRSALLTVHSCDSSVVIRDVSLVQARSPIFGSFEAGASTSTVAGRCTVDYWVTTTQTGIQGVSGTFQWTVFGSGSLSS
jgi:hypothetical protein